MYQHGILCYRNDETTLKLWNQIIMTAVVRFRPSHKQTVWWWYMYGCSTCAHCTPTLHELYIQLVYWLMGPAGSAGGSSSRAVNYTHCFTVSHLLLNKQ